ncbi:mediator of RNA polymeras-like protein II transcription subunit 6 [Halenospora varia]|nr:mediator of RNA polymeras-like protein II transcription subunit 6 [Halenospora varia]
MASQEAPLDEMRWSDPFLAQGMGIHANTILFYFAASPFFDTTSNNAVVYSQSINNPQMTHLLSTREIFEGRLKTMAGMEYIVAQEPADPMTGTGVWVINKQTRRKRSNAEDEVLVHSTYFVVGWNVYMAPSMSDILGMRTLSILTSLNNFFSSAAALPSFTPSLGNTYLPPPKPRPNQGSQSQLGQASKENTPLPESLQNPKKSSQPSTNNSTYLANRLLEETLNITLKYGEEYMDENPITGEPGAFHLSTTGRTEKDKNKLMVPALSKPGTGTSSKAPTPAPPPLKTDLEPAKKSKGEKTPTKSPGSAKIKRKKSKVLSAGAISPK